MKAYASGNPPGCRERPTVAPTPSYPWNWTTSSMNDLTLDVHTEAGDLDLDEVGVLSTVIRSASNTAAASRCACRPVAEEVVARERDRDRLALGRPAGLRGAGQHTSSRPPGRMSAAISVSGPSDSLRIGAPLEIGGRPLQWSSRRRAVRIILVRAKYADSRSTSAVASETSVPCPPINPASATGPSKIVEWSNFVRELALDAVQGHEPFPILGPPDHDPGTCEPEQVELMYRRPSSSIAQSVASIQSAPPAHPRGRQTRLHRQGVDAREAPRATLAR